MKSVVVNGAVLNCTFGSLQSLLHVTSQHHAVINGQTVATENDFTNIPPFGLCQSPTNPQVIAAQGAPQPCTPVLQRWKQGSNVLQVNGAKALTKSSCTTCTYANGTITIQTNEFVQTD